MAALQQNSGECYHGSLTSDLCGGVTMAALKQNSAEYNHSSLIAELWGVSPWQQNFFEVSSWQSYSSTLSQYHHGHLTDEFWGVSPW